MILQRIREAERDMMFEEYRDRVGELITGIVQQSDSRYTLVQLRERVEALLPKSEQVDGERYDHSQRIKAVIKDVSNSTKGPRIIVSRRDPELIKSLFELEVPEIADGLVEITGVAREPGYRSKIAVVSHVDGVDPVGACVGPRGSRVRMVVSELRGEKIDIIPYNDEPARFVAKALSPARVREVLVDDDGKQATVIVPDDQLSLAIGREGQNARLAARLTGWRIDIRSETEFAAEEAEHGYEQDDSPGPLRGDPLERPPLPERCAAWLALLRHPRPPGARHVDTDEVGAVDGRGARRGCARVAALEAEERSRGNRRRRVGGCRERNSVGDVHCEAHEQARPRDRQGAAASSRRSCSPSSARPASRSRPRRRTSMRPSPLNALGNGSAAGAAAAGTRQRSRAGARGGRAPAVADAARPRADLGTGAPTASERPAQRRLSEHKRPTRDSLQGERNPGSAGGRRRVVIDSQASRRAPGGGPAQPNQPPRRQRRGRRRRGVYDEEAESRPVADGARRARRDPGQLGLDRQGRGRVSRRPDARGDQEADGARRDEDARPRR